MLAIGRHESCNFGEFWVESTSQQGNPTVFTVFTVFGFKKGRKNAYILPNTVVSSKFWAPNTVNTVKASSFWSFLVCMCPT